MASREPEEHIEPCAACEQRKGSFDAKRQLMKQYARY